MIYTFEGKPLFEVRDFEIIVLDDVKREELAHALVEATRCLEEAHRDLVHERRVLENL